MGFCFCLNTQELDTIFLVFTNVDVMLKPKFLRVRGPGHFGDLGHPYFGGTIFPSSAFVIPSHYVYSMVHSCS